MSRWNNVPVALDTWLRGGNAQFMGYVQLALAFAYLYAAWTFFAIPSGGPQSEAITAAVFELIFLFLMLAAFRHGVGYLRAGLLITEDRVIVKNPLRVVSTPLRDVDRFVEGLLSGGSPGIVLVKTNGSSLSVRSFSRVDSFIWNQDKRMKEFQPIAAELNQILDVARDERGLPTLQRVTRETPIVPEQVFIGMSTADHPLGLPEGRRRIVRIADIGCAVACGMVVLAFVFGRASQSFPACAGAPECTTETVALLFFYLGLGSAAAAGLISLVARTEPRRK